MFFGRAGCAARPTWQFVWEGTDRVGPEVPTQRNIGRKSLSSFGRYGCGLDGYGLDVRRAWRLVDLQAPLVSVRSTNATRRRTRILAIGRCQEKGGAVVLVAGTSVDANMGDTLSAPPPHALI
jgi:hypothetical protein